MKKLILITLAVLVNSAFGGNKIAYWGNITGQWKRLLGKDYEMEVLSRTQEMPVEEFSKYKIVILSNIGKMAKISSEKLQTINEYVKNGGILYVDYGTVCCLKDKPGFNLSPSTSMIGASAYRYGPAKGITFQNDENIFKDVDKDGFVKKLEGERMPMVGKLCGGKSLISSKKNSLLLFNRYGKGMLIYFSLTPFKAKGPFVGKIIKNIFNTIMQKDGCAKIIPVAKSNNLVKVNGKSYHLVIFGGKYSAAAKFLKEKLTKMTGKDNFSDIGSEKQIYMHIGATPLINKKKLLDNIKNYYGYGIIFNGKELLLPAKCAKGAVYAVNDFLKTFCGYRYFYPGQGEILPEIKDFVLPGDIKKWINPSVASMNVAWTNRQYGYFSRDNRLLIMSTHSFYKVIPPAKYAKTHPEYYPMIQGKRFVPSGKCKGTWQPCMKNPDLVKITMEYAEKYFKKHPHMMSLPLGVNDGGGDCQCEFCAGLRKKYGNQYIPYYNEIARRLQKAYPEKMLSFIAYGRGVETAPKNLKLEPNILVEICSGLRNNMDEMRKWEAAGARHFGLYDYMYANGGGYVVPRYYPHVFGKAWKKAFKEYGLASIWEELYPRIWIFAAPRQYVLNELAWDMNQDIDKLLNDYFSKMYAEAAVPVKQMFARFEDVYSRKQDPLWPMSDWKSNIQLDGYTLEDIDYLDAKLKEARNLIKDPKATARLRSLEKLYQLVKLYLKGAAFGNELAKKSKVESEKQVELLVKYAAEAVKCCKKINNFKLSPAEEKNIFTSRGNLKQFTGQSYLQLYPYVEKNVDKAFDAISAFKSKKLSWKQVKSFWLKELEKTTGKNLKPLILTQIYVRENKLNNLIANPGFEPDPQQQTAWSKKQKSSDWQSFRGLKGWSTWHFQQSVTEFMLDKSVKYSGKCSAAIGENQISGSILTMAKVSPKCRYRLKLRVKQRRNGAEMDCQGKSGGAGIRFKSVSGRWLDKGSSVRIKYPEKNSDWQLISTTFTPVAGSHVALILLGAPRQKKQDRIWFDDVVLEKIYDPEYF